MTEKAKGGDVLVRIEGVSKRFGKEVALTPIDLEIRNGELLALLGPSGCGKTTLLRIIGGFEAATEGRVLIDGEDMTGISPNRRPVNMVFQSYAIFPHMTVQENVEYGLKVTGVGKEESERRATEMLDMVQLGAMSGRLPDQLSGGQRQRVALARALVKRPRLLLLDEPLSALDANLRALMQEELVNIQRKVGITFVMVTHDQDEALSIASRVVVMNKGTICQDGAPSEIYEYPTSRFVAGFMGTMNLYEAEAKGAGGGLLTVSEPRLGEIVVPTRAPVDPAAHPRIGLAVRPEKVGVWESEPDEPGLKSYPGTIRSVQYHGNESRLRLELDCGAEVLASIANDRRGEESWEPGERAWVGWLPTDCLVLTE